MEERRQVKFLSTTSMEYSKMIIREHIQIDILGVFSKFLDYIFIIFIKFRYRINVLSKSKLLLY